MIPQILQLKKRVVRMKILLVPKTNKTVLALAPEKQGTINNLEVILNNIQATTRILAAIETTSS